MSRYKNSETSSHYSQPCDMKNAFANADGNLDCGLPAVHYYHNCNMCEPHYQHFRLINDGKSQANKTAVDFLAGKGINRPHDMDDKEWIGVLREYALDLVNKIGQNELNKAWAYRLRDRYMAGEHLSSLQVMMAEHVIGKFSR